MIAIIIDVIIVTDVTESIPEKDIEKNWMAITFTSGKQSYIKCCLL